MFKTFSIFFLLFSVVNTNANPVKNQSDFFELSIVHINDFHARFEEIDTNGGSCKEGNSCIGGFSRLYRQIRNMLDEKPDTVLLNAGDNFQGTLYYTIGKWNITQEFLNKLPFDATVMGNHEFDDTIKGAVPFIKALKHPVVVCNIDDSLEPSFQGIYTKSTVIERNGKRIGIIGVIISTCNLISSTGNLKFYLESPSVNKEAERLVEEEGVFTNIVLSHCGYKTDIAIAQNASEKISLIVGGHSHNFLYTGDNSPGPDEPIGPYPTVVQSKNGKQVLITQAAAYSKYVGNITIFLDENGEIADYSGAPIYLDAHLPKDDQIDQDLLPWKRRVDSQGDVVIGSSLVTLDRDNCRYEECTLGNFVTDAMVYSWTDISDENSWTYASIAVANAGGLRTNIQIGDITYADMITAQPFGNTFDVGEIQGKYIKQLLEITSTERSKKIVATELRLMHYSGIQVEIDMNRPDGNRVLSVKVRCQACKIPVYENLDFEKTYRIVIISYLLRNSSDYEEIFKNIQNIKVGRIDMDVYIDYLAHKSPVFQEEQGRIIIYT